MLAFELNVIIMHVAELTYDELIIQGKAKEAEDYKTAISFYQKAIKLELANPIAYNRLMIVYRQQKMYSEELKLIDNAIKNVQQAYNKRQTKYKGSSNISKLSNALMKSTGLIDKKGNHTYAPEPIPTWRKRKQTILKRISKKEKRKS